MAEGTMLQSLKFIAEHADEPLTLQQIASASGYSQYYFSRIFKKYMGISVMEYVKRQKLKLASEAIIDGKGILEAALGCGYDSHSGFTKAFQREFGFSPVLLKAMVMQLNELGGGCGMNHIYMEKMTVHESKEQLLEKLLEMAEENGRGYVRDALLDAYSFADVAYKGKMRYSGDEYITHPLNVAILLVAMEAEQKLVIAGMMCDVFNKTQTSPEQIQQVFGTETRELLWKVKEFEAETADNYADDEVLIIRLAELLHNMRTAEFMEEDVRIQKAEKTIRFFLPFSVKLGNQKLTEELNDLALAYLSRE